MGATPIWCRSSSGRSTGKLKLHASEGWRVATYAPTWMGTAGTVRAAKCKIGHPRWTAWRGRIKVDSRVVAGDREDYEAWCTLLGQLKVRGLEVPRLIASNACSALLEAAAELFPNAFAAWRVTLRSDPARPVAGHGYDESAVFSR